jgi:hypothetical protein
MDMFAIPRTIGRPVALELCTVIAHSHEMSFRVVSGLVPFREESLFTPDAYAPVMEVGANIEINVVASLESVCAFTSRTV